MLWSVEGSCLLSGSQWWTLSALSLLSPAVSWVCQLSSLSSAPRLPPRLLFPGSRSSHAVAMEAPAAASRPPGAALGPGDGAVTLPEAVAPRALGAREQSAPSPISGVRFETFRRPRPGGQICWSPTSGDRTPGVGVTAACYRPTLWPPEDHSRSPYSCLPSRRCL